MPPLWFWVIYAVCVVVFAPFTLPAMIRAQRSFWLSYRRAWLEILPRRPSREQRIKSLEKKLGLDD